VLVVAIAVKKSDTLHWGYTISVGATAAAFAFVGLLLLALGSRYSSGRHPADKVIFAAPVLGDMSLSSVVALFLFVWWGIAVYILTFYGPFVDTTNGYFAVWIGFASSIGGIGAALPGLQASASATSFSVSLIGLGVCAVVVGLDLTAAGGLSRQMTYGMVVAVLTFAAVAMMLLQELAGAPLDATLARNVHIVIVLIWGLAALWLTFTGPFIATGNGYFALWAGLVCASRLVLDVQKARIAAALSNETLAAMWGQLVAAVVLILAVSALPPQTTTCWGYALAVGIVSAAVSLVAALLLENLAGRVPLLPLPPSVAAASGAAALTLNGLLATFLFLWWGVGTGILTIHGPFLSTGNGYFSAWLGFGFSLLGIGLSLSRTKAAATSGRATLAVLAICSLVIVATASPHIADDAKHRTQATTAVVVACTTLVRILVDLFLAQHGASCGALLEKVRAAATFLAWTLLASWTSFTGPFAETGNGFFAAWAGVLCSVLLLLARLPPLTSAATTRDEVGEASAFATPVADAGVQPLQSTAEPEGSATGTWE